MKKCCMVIVLCIIALAIQIQICYAIDMGIVTGNKNGTDYQFGMDMKSLMAEYDINLKVYPSNGSIDNIYSVYKKHSVQLGIVNSDVLAFVAKVQSNKTLKMMAKKIKVVLPLYDEEVHIVARKGIADFNDLSGRRVAVGEDGSGTYLTARLLFKVSGVKPAAMVNIGMQEALMQLKEGNIDAMFCVSGAPVKLFVNDIRERDNLKLIPVMNKEILKFYPRAEIPAGTYSWEHKPVDTIGVKSLIVTYNFRSDNCQKVGRFARILYDNLDQLIRNGHPKWKAVDFHYELKGWEQYDCVKKALEQPAPKEKKAGPPNPVFDAIKKALKD